MVSPTLAPVQRPQSQPPSDLDNVLARLGPDKYSDFDFDHISLDSYFAEYFEDSSQVIVKGRLKANISFWQSIGASKFILDTLSFGYKIPTDFHRNLQVFFLIIIAQLWVTVIL